jgi:hypothetical protein
MAADFLERDNLSLYVVAGVPRSSKRNLQEFIQREAKGDGDVLLVDDDLAEWLLARLRDEKRPRAKRTSAERALWRAYRALNAARYYLQDEAEDAGASRQVSGDPVPVPRSAGATVHQEDGLPFTFVRHVERSAVGVIELDATLRLAHRPGSVQGRCRLRAVRDQQHRDSRVRGRERGYRTSA